MSAKAHIPHIVELRPHAPGNNDKRQLINAFRFFPTRRTPRSSGSCVRTLRKIMINAGKLMRAANACRICPPRRTPRSSGSCVRTLPKIMINASYLMRAANAFRFFPPRRTSRHIVELRPPAPKNNDKRQLINAFRFFPPRRTPRHIVELRPPAPKTTINAS